MQTYRLYLIGETDGIVYGIKEYEAETDASAAERAEALLPGEPVWAGQRLLKELSPSGRAGGGDVRGAGSPHR